VILIVIVVIGVVATKMAGGRQSTNNSRENVANPVYQDSTNAYEQTLPPSGYVDVANDEEC